MGGGDGQNRIGGRGAGRGVGGVRWVVRVETNRVGGRGRVGGRSEWEECAGAKGGGGDGRGGLS